MKVRNITAGVALALLGIAPGAFAFNARGAQQSPVYGKRHQTNRFRGMDRNGDGVITRDEWRGNDKSFRKHDRNGDGVISAADERGDRDRQFNRESDDDERGHGQFNRQSDDDDERGHGKLKENKHKHHLEDRDDD